MPVGSKIERVGCDGVKGGLRRCLLRGQICDVFVRRCRILPLWLLRLAI
jgi:hypothetical protein